MLMPRPTRDARASWTYGCLWLIPQSAGGAGGLDCALVAAAERRESWDTDHNDAIPDIGDVPRLAGLCPAARRSQAGSADCGISAAPHDNKASHRQARADDRRAGVGSGFYRKTGR